MLPGSMGWPLRVYGLAIIHRLGGAAFRLSEPDWFCPALINAARAFLAVSALRVLLVGPPAKRRLGDRNS